jgi:hypothetical protein
MIVETLTGRFTITWHDDGHAENLMVYDNGYEQMLYVSPEDTASVSELGERHLIAEYQP